MFDLRPCASSASVKDLPIHHGISVLGDRPRRLYAGRVRSAGAVALPAFAGARPLRAFPGGAPGETLLVHMKYENTSTNANKRGWNKSVVSYIKSRCNGRIADFTPRMTLADARGKILFVIAMIINRTMAGSISGPI